MKEKYGSEAEDVENDESEDSEEDESEDENGEELTPAVDAAILRTLARIKRKDPAIYEADKSIFQGQFSLVITFLLITSFIQRSSVRQKRNQ